MNTPVLKLWSVCREPPEVFSEVLVSLMASDIIDGVWSFASSGKGFEFWQTSLTSIKLIPTKPVCMCLYWFYHFLTKELTFIEPAKRRVSPMCQHFEISPNDMH